jgi:predicted SnoaL-like aldol condensation-catalyzing enzyme
MSTEANTAKLQQLMDEVLTKHNLAVLDEIFHADYVEHEPPPGMGPGRDGLRQWLAGWIAAFPDAQWTIEEQIADGDQVWTRSVWQGTHQAPFLAYRRPGSTSPWPRGPSTSSPAGRSPTAGSSWMAWG